MYKQLSILTTLFLIEFYHIFADTVYVKLGEKALLDFTFAQVSKDSVSDVQWSFLPLSPPQPLSETVDNGFRLNTSYHASRYKNDISEVTCPESLANPPGRTCRLARLSISHVIPADEGTYRAQIFGPDPTDCSPCSGEMKLLIRDSANNVGHLPTDGLPDSPILPDDFTELDDVPVYFYAPPFSLDFNMNSTVCAGQSFEFQCRAEPINYGINLTLYHLDPLFTLTSLEAVGRSGGGIDFRNTSTRVIQTSVRRSASTQHLRCKLDSVRVNDTGGYLCVASVPNMQAARWSYMFLQVDDCTGLSALASTKSLRERALEVFKSPSTLTFICLLLVTILVTLAALLIFFCRRHRLPLLFFGSKKWTIAANKVVRETNLLYPWATSTHHTCFHEVAKENTNDSTTSYIGLRSGGECSREARNLQVPAVIIQVDASAVARSGGGGGEEKPNSYKIPSDPAWEVPRDCIRLGRQIGAGAFGVVFAGVVSEPAKVLPGLRRRESSDCPTASAQELTVAVKTLRDNFTEQELADLVREMEILKQFDPHPHVIQLYGVCTQNGRLQVLVELAPYGNLRDFLMDRRPRSGQKSGNRPWSRLSTGHLVNFGLQVARGMDYLTRLNIVHRDLAARNILVGSRFVAKIADFGLTRTVCDYYRKCSDGRLPIKWMAPESIFDRRYTAKSDVWSFGILLWEIFSFGGTPYPTLSAEGLLKALQLGFRNEQPLASPGPVYNLMLACWSLDPLARPTFAHLVASLQQVYDEAATATDPEHAFLTSPSLASSSSSSFTSCSSTSSRSSSPTVSTVYLTLNNTANTITNINADSSNGNGHGYNNQSIVESAISPSICYPFHRATVSQTPRPEQLPCSSLSEHGQFSPGPVGTPSGAGNNVLMNSCYADRGQYLQSIHKAFSMHCNYVVPPRPSEQRDCLGPRS